MLLCSIPGRAIEGQGEKGVRLLFLVLKCMIACLELFYATSAAYRVSWSDLSCPESRECATNNLLQRRRLSGIRACLERRPGSVPCGAVFVRIDATSFISPPCFDSVQIAFVASVSLVWLSFWAFGSTLFVRNRRGRVIVLVLSRLPVESN